MTIFISDTCKRYMAYFNAQKHRHHHLLSYTDMYTVSSKIKAHGIIFLKFMTNKFEIHYNNAIAGNASISVSSVNVIIDSVLRLVVNEQGQ